MQSIDLSSWCVRDGSNYIIFVPLDSESNLLYTAWVLRGKDGKQLHKVKFGNKYRPHYKDNTPCKFWSKLDNHDEKARIRYHERYNNHTFKQHKVIKYSSMWFARKYLW